MIFLTLLEVSYNQPIFSTCARWDPNAITFADYSTLGITSTGIFITKNNTVYATSYGLHSVLVWSEGSPNATQSIFTNLNSSNSIFVTVNGDVYADSGYAHERVDKWTKSTGTFTTAMVVNGTCGGMFVDIYDSLYCSQSGSNQVLRKNVDSDVNTSVVVAGNGTAGLGSNLLSSPYGIFVDIDLSLYVADYGNNRIQLFRAGQSSGTTVAGNGAPGTIILDRPDIVLLDGAGYVFIVDQWNFRVVGSGPNGFRCIVGCSGNNGSAANRLFVPFGLSFDSHGNLFVSDTLNNRIQKFLLARNSCGECLRSVFCMRDFLLALRKASIVRDFLALRKSLVSNHMT